MHAQNAAYIKVMAFPRLCEHNNFLVNIGAPLGYYEFLTPFPNDSG